MMPIALRLIIGQDLPSIKTKEKKNKPKETTKVIDYNKKLGEKIKAEMAKKAELEKINSEINSDMKEAKG